MNWVWPKPTLGLYDAFGRPGSIRPHGSMGYDFGGAPFTLTHAAKFGRFRSHCGKFGLSLPFMMSRIENETTSFPVRGRLKSMTALEYLFQTVTCAMTPGVDTLTIDTRVSVPPVPIGRARGTVQRDLPVRDEQRGRRHVVIRAGDRIARARYREQHQGDEDGKLFHFYSYRELRWFS